MNRIVRGPALAGCVVAVLLTATSALCADGAHWVAVSGRIVSTEGARLGWVVYDEADGTIQGIGHLPMELPAEVQRIYHAGYIFPGLLDTHNHCHWNSIPLWRPGTVYANRYAWQATDAYQTEVRGPFDDLEDAGLWHESLKYGEIRAMLGGSTLIQGSDGTPQGYLVRNLAPWPWRCYSLVGDVTSISRETFMEYQAMAAAGSLRRLFLHAGEGKRDDPRSQAEFDYLLANGGLFPGVVLIHSVAFDRSDYETMAAYGVRMVWSPKSNEVLYGETADILAALAAGVTVSLAPDWSISGSDNLLEELKVADAYSREHLGGALTPQDLFAMATIIAADVAGIDGPDAPLGERLGRLAPGYQADLFLAPVLDDDPFASLLLTTPEDIELVLIDGVPVCGQHWRMRQFLDSPDLDRVVVESRNKTLYILDPTLGRYGAEHFGELVQRLDVVLDELAPLVEDEPQAPRATAPRERVTPQRLSRPWHTSSGSGPVSERW